MSENIVYLNGQYVKWSEAKISIHDRGYMWGDSVYDHSRSFNGKPHMWEAHIARLFSSLSYINLKIDLTPEQIYDISLEVFHRNKENLSPDCTLVHRISRGTQWDKPASNQTVIIDCVPMELLIAPFAKSYIEGARVITSPFRRTPPQCLDPKAKLGNKLNHIMAEQQVKALDPAAYALMLDADGFLAECSAQNIFIVKDGRILSPKRDKMLEGIVRSVIKTRLAKELNIEFIECDLSMLDAYNADEIFITATSFSIFPVSKLDGRTIGKSVPGPITKKLTDAWSATVGIDIVKQGLEYAQRKSPGAASPLMVR